MNYDVIIIGGGPTGTTLGIELGLNNIKTLILEKYASPLLSPRAQFINARSMEFFMRWQIDTKLRDKQLLPYDYPVRGVWCSKLNGKTYAAGNPNDQLNDSISPQMPTRIPLWLTEEVLRERLQDFPCVTFLKEHHVVDVNLEKNTVTVTAEYLGKKTNFTAPYAIACDGANSITRNSMGIDFNILAPPQRMVSIVFESSELAKHITVDKGILYYLLDSIRPGGIGPIDIVNGLWYAQVKDDHKANSIEELDLHNLLNEMVGFIFDKKILQAHFWNMHTQIAKSFAKENRVFLVGDSAHAYAPTGGFGLNTGLGDAVNLSWKLAAVINHHAHPDILKTYEQERMPVCLNTLKAAQKNADDMMAIRLAHDPKNDSEGFALANAAHAKQHINSLGLTMGYAYFNSPLTLLHENQSTEAMPASKYQPTIAPGYFLPHKFIDKNNPIYKILSPTQWTLIVSNKIDLRITNELKKTFHKFNLPLKIVTLAKNLYFNDFVLIRPDWHIAFTGNKLDSDYIEDYLKLYFLDSHTTY